MTNLLKPPPWTVDAACLNMAGAQLDLWHPDDELTPVQQAGQHAIARRICASCPVRLSCALEALTSGLPDGVWGGLTPADRRRIARDLPGVFPAPGAAVHGTRSRYVAGCTAGPAGRACKPCLRAHRDYERHQRAVRREQRLLAAVTEPPFLTVAVGRGRWRAIPGQYLLIPDHALRSAAA